jgi:hypothetical protein
MNVWKFEISFQFNFLTASTTTCYIYFSTLNKSHHDTLLRFTTPISLLELKLASFWFWRKWIFHMTTFHLGLKFHSKKLKLDLVLLLTIKYLLKCQIYAFGFMNDLNLRQWNILSKFGIKGMKLGQRKYQKVVVVSSHL